MASQACNWFSLWVSCLYGKALMRGFCMYACVYDPLPHGRMLGTLVTIVIEILYIHES